MSELLNLLVDPFGITIVVIVVISVLVLRRKWRAAMVLFLLNVFGLLILSIPLVADALMAPLEQSYPQVSIQEMPPRKCAVLLGGSVSNGDGSNCENTSTRFGMAVQLVKRNKAQMLLVSGFSSFETVVDYCGLPAESVHFESDSSSTRENAVNSKKVLDYLLCEKPLLITSASHMPRAVAAFGAVDVQTIPVPTEFRSTSMDLRGPSRMKPSFAALVRTGDALHEWVGLWFYRLKGWS